jgi:hypothetical protein
MRSNYEATKLAEMTHLKPPLSDGPQGLESKALHT